MSYRETQEPPTLEKKITFIKFLREHAGFKDLIVFFICLLPGIGFTLERSDRIAELENSLLVCRTAGPWFEPDVERETYPGLELCTNLCAGSVGGVPTVLPNGNCLCLEPGRAPVHIEWVGNERWWSMNGPLLEE